LLALLLVRPPNTVYAVVVAFPRPSLRSLTRAIDSRSNDTNHKRQEKQRKQQLHCRKEGQTKDVMRGGGQQQLAAAADAQSDQLATLAGIAFLRSHQNLNV
jgi:hypothetical protein